MKKRKTKSGYSVVVTLKSGEVQVGEPFPTEAQAKSYRKYLRRGKGRWSSVRSIKVLKSNRRRVRRNKQKGTKIRVRVSRPSYGKPFYGDIISVYRRTPGKEYDEGVYSSHHGRVDKGYLIQRSPTSGASWYTKEDFRLAKRRGLRRNEEYARQIPRRDRPMRGRGFDKKFDVSAGSDYNDLYKILTTGRNPGQAKKIGDNTSLYFYSPASPGNVPGGPIIVRLYQTPILTYYPTGEVDVNFGGYMTPTTFSRINNLVPYGWNLRKKGGKLALENSWGQRAVIRLRREGKSEYAVRLTSDKAYLID